MPFKFLPGTSKQSLSTRVGSLLYFTWSQIVKIKVRENIWKTGTFQIHFFHEIRQFFFTDDQIGQFIIIPQRIDIDDVLRCLPSEGVKEIFDRGLVEEIVLPGAEISRGHFLEIR